MAMADIDVTSIPPDIAGKKRAGLRTPRASHLMSSCPCRVAHGIRMNVARMCRTATANICPASLPSSA